MGAKVMSPLSLLEYYFLFIFDCRADTRTNSLWLSLLPMKKSCKLVASRGT